MRVQHNIAAMNSYRNFNVNNSKMSKNLEKLSSGYSINRAGDDAAGLAVSEKMRWQTTGLEAAVKNAKDGIGMIQTAEGALTEVHDMLNRMNYLAEQASNGTYDADDIANLDAEAIQLLKEIDRIGTSTEFNGVKLLDGTLNATLQIGTESSDTMTVSILGNNDGDPNAPATEKTKKGLFGGKLDARGLEGWRASGSSTPGVFESYKTSTTAKAWTIRGKMGEIKNAINRVSAARADLGAMQNRLEHTINSLNVSKENITDAESRIRDTDVADEMMKFTKNSIMNQAAQAMLAQSNQLPQGVLQLLQ